MATTDQLIYEKIFYTYLQNKQILTEDKKDIMIKKTSDSISGDLQALREEGELRTVVPTNARITEVYFGDINTASFSQDDINNTIDSIRAILEVWESNRASVAD
jgi:hypothetical protein